MTTTKTKIYERMSRNLQTSFADLHSQSKSSLVIIYLPILRWGIIAFRDINISIPNIQALTIASIDDFSILIRPILPFRTKTVVNHHFIAFIGPFNEN